MTEVIERNLRKTRTGIVISNKMDKTIIVEIKQRTQDPLFKKYLNQTKKVKVHDEKNEAGVGDKVFIEETRKLSKEKHWRLVEIVEKAK
jgi:small subunit ribosomal protein S17